MNKYQEALNRLVEGNYLTNREKKQFANILQELVDKETAMKPKIEQQNDYIVYDYLYQPDVETTPIGGFSIPESEYIQNLAYKPIEQQKYITLSNVDLFIIIKALLWHSSATQMPSDEEIKKFIKTHREKENGK